VQAIKYANCWEDAYLLASALKVDEKSNVLSIASGGDNSLFLLSYNPKKMVCVDTNQSQLFLTELKAIAIRELPKESTLHLLGFEPSLNRKAIFKSIESHLSYGAQSFWNDQLQWIEKGLIHQGKFERYLRIFGKQLLPRIKSEQKILELTAQKNEKAQIQFYHEQWNTWNWRLLFRSFFNRFLTFSSAFFWSIVPLLNL